MRLLCFSLLLAAFMRTGNAEPAFVDLAADIEMTSWGNSAYDNPPMFRSKLWKIRCVVGTNAWLITASNQVYKASGEINFYLWHYTGSNLVKQWRAGDPASPIETRTSPFNGDPESLKNAEFTEPILRITWLAFCSGPFLNRPDGQLPLPNVFKWLLPSDYAFPPSGLRNEVVRFDDDLGLPISIDVLSKGGDPVLQYRTLQGPVASPASTNVADWSFPLQFRAIQYARNRQATNTWQADSIFHGKLSSIKIGSEPKLSINAAPARRSLPGNAYVLKAGNLYNELTNPPASNRATISLRKSQNLPERICFAITNSEPDEILIWNVRVQVKSAGESPGTDVSAGRPFTTIILNRAKPLSCPASPQNSRCVRRTVRCGEFAYSTQNTRKISPAPKNTGAHTKLFLSP